MRSVPAGPEILIKSATQYVFSEIKFQNTNIGKGCNIDKGIKNIKYTFRPLSTHERSMRSSPFSFTRYLNL